MADESNRELEEYRRYLERLADSRSTDMFSNGGKEHASILMSILFQKTKTKARVFSNGFKPDLITTAPYWYELIDYLSDSQHQLSILVESDDYVNEEPLRRVREEMERRNHDGTIQIRLISDKGKKMIEGKFGSGHTNFAIFDNDKFRFEYDPENFRAFGSFNQPEKCEILSALFDEAYNVSTPLWPQN